MALNPSTAAPIAVALVEDSAGLRESLAVLLKAIQDVHHGGAPMSADIAARVVEYFNRQGATGASIDTDLTPRESEILRLLAEGSLYKEIAAQLGISFDTVQWHIPHIYQRLHVRSRSEAIAMYLRQDRGAPEPS